MARLVYRRDHGGGGGGNVGDNVKSRASRDLMAARALPAKPEMQPGTVHGTSDRTLYLNPLLFCREHLAGNLCHNAGSVARWENKVGRDFVYAPLAYRFLVFVRGFMLIAL